MLQASLKGTETMEITLRDLWNIFKRCFAFVLLGAILLGALVYVYTANFATRVYISSTNYALFMTDTSENSVESLNNGIVVGAKSISTLNSYLMTRTTMENVLRYIDDMHALEPENADYQLVHEYSVSQLMQNFTFRQSEDDTDLVFGVSCKAYSPHDSYVLLKAFGAVMNERAENVLLRVFYIEECDPPAEGTLTTPHTARNAAIAAIIGAIVPYVIFLIITLVDSRIKDEEDLKKDFSHPVLGKIPHI
jgi:capsular polysaccharide biosynthesis protein